MSLDIVELTNADQAAIFDVINAAAQQYEGVIPAASDTDPYMPMAELGAAMERMEFYGASRDRLLGVIGVQERSDVSLIRHLYVRPAVQREGIGTELLETGIERAESDRILVGTWKAAEWAIEFYERYGFTNLGTDTALLSSYWDIPDHQMTASVVLEYEL